MKNAKNIFASVSGLALMGATAVQGLAQQPAHVMAPSANSRFKFAGSPAFVSGWIKVNPATFKNNHADCSAIYMKYESDNGQMESTRGTGNAAGGTCYYKFEVPNLKGPVAGRIYMKLESFSWGASRPVVVKPDESLSLNFARTAIK